MTNAGSLKKILVIKSANENQIIQLLFNRRHFLRKARLRQPVNNLSKTILITQLAEMTSVWFTSAQLNVNVWHDIKNWPDLSSYSVGRCLVEAPSNSLAANTTLRVCIDYFLHRVFSDFKQKTKFLREQHIDRCYYTSTTNMINRNAPGNLTHSNIKVTPARNSVRYD